MKKDTKQRLFEVMGKLDPSFKKLNENQDHYNVVRQQQMEFNERHKKRSAFIRNFLKKHNPNFKLVIDKNRREWFSFSIIDTSQDEFINGTFNMNRTIWFGNTPFGSYSDEEFKNFINSLEKAIEQHNEKTKGS